MQRARGEALVGCRGDEDTHPKPIRKGAETLGVESESGPVKVESVHPSKPRADLRGSPGAVDAVKDRNDLRERG